jgi:serine/threonine protein kinase
MGWFENAHIVFLAMEYFPYGDLGRYIASGITEPEAKRITIQLLDGLKVMHENKFTHRDLKPEVSLPPLDAQSSIEGEDKLTKSIRTSSLLPKRRTGG